VCVWVFPFFFFSVIPVIMIYRYQNVCVCTKCREPAQFSPARIPRLLLNCVRNIFERHSNTHTRAEREQQQMYRLIQKRTWPYLCLIRWTI
jgi:recombinational DNA repair protein (RecF pathway)